MSAWVARYLWQVALHSTVLGIILYIWTRRIHLASGPAKRRLLAATIAVPLLTAAVPGRSDLAFAEGAAWFNSARILALPLFGGFRLYDVAIAIAVISVVVTIWQEVWPAIRGVKTSTEGLPGWLCDDVRGLPGWDRCAVRSNSSTAIVLATAGTPAHPRLIVSRGALSILSRRELAAVIRHEHAHWRAGRWLQSHVLFSLRLLQCYHPIAMWAFREYCLEMEIACDAEAAAATDPDTVIRALLSAYKHTDRREIATRSALRKRVHVLMEPAVGRERLPQPAIAAAIAVMLCVLPWIV